MNLKPITVMAALAVALLMTNPAAGQGLPLMTSGGENNSWVSDGAGTWTNEPSADRYNNYECSFLETPQLPGVVAAAGPLTFDFEHSIENYYDGSVVMVSVDGGETWSVVESGMETRTTYGPYVRDCVTSFGAAAPAAVISGSGSGSASIDLSGAVAPTDMFSARLVLASDYCCLYDGWVVSNIAMAGVPLA